MHYVFITDKHLLDSKITHKFNNFFNLSVGFPKNNKNQILHSTSAAVKLFPGKPQLNASDGHKLKIPFFTANYFVPLVVFRAPD